jgi:hypothetical protein
MNALSRRDILVGAAAIAATASIPTLPAIAESATVAKDVIPAWIVGTPGEFDWQHVGGRTAEEAIRNFVCETVGGDGCEEGNEPDCDCEWCYAIIGLEAERKPMWDGKSDVTPGDWLRSGTGHVCSRCSYETFPEEGGHPVGDEAVCEECMTLADWDIADPERAAEIRAGSVSRGKGTGRHIACFVLGPEK